MADLFEEIKRIDANLRGFEAEIENAEQLSKKLVRMCGILITGMHRGSNSVEKELEEAKAIASSLIEIDEANGNMKIQALQEYAEAYIFYSVMMGKRVPSSADTGVGDRAFLLGMMDAIGELKREVFDSLSKNDVVKASKYTNTMQDMYDACRGIRYQEHVLPGFRRKQDVARILIESCTSELLHFKH